jgi:hypothetical protein
MSESGWKGLKDWQDSERRRHNETRKNAEIIIKNKKPHRQANCLYGFHSLKLSFVRD